MLLYGIVAVVILWWFLNKSSHANTAVVAKTIKIVGGVLALGVAAILGSRGRIDLALLMGGAGAWLLGWSGFRIPGFGGNTQRTPGSVSRVRSVMIEMELDHDTGEIDGTVLAGALAEHRLSSLDEADLEQLLAECRSSDPDGVRLLEAYLARRFPEWRDSAPEHEEAPSGRRPPSGEMTEEEAFQVLGLKPGASLDEIHKAHRTLMKKLHPDQGGSTYLASRVNQAREVLTNRQR